MIPIINKNDCNLSINYNQKFEDCIESNTYTATYKNNPVITKFFRNEEAIKNKINKIKLIKERTKDIDLVVTADAFIEDNGKIVGYMMKDIKGINIYNSYLSTKKEVLIWYLKELAKGLKELHKLGIIAGDYTHNTIVKDNKLYFIDHDNFMIDNYQMDQENRLIWSYKDKKSEIDKNLDFYILNLYTFSIFRHYNLPFVTDLYYPNNSIFNFRDPEIRQIFENTINLNESFDGQLIIDKIDTVKDIKKIKSKKF